MYIENKNMRLNFSILLCVIFSFIGFSQVETVRGPIVSIDQGYAGVQIKTFGEGLEKEEIFYSGTHLINPLNKMIIYDLRSKQDSLQLESLSEEGLSIGLKIKFNHSVISDKIGFLHDKIGPEYLQKVVEPTIRSASREVIGGYTAGDIYSTPIEQLEGEIHQAVSQELIQNYLKVDLILIIDIDLPEALLKALKQKEEAEEQALKKVYLSREIDKLRKSLFHYKDLYEECEKNKCQETTLKSMKQKINNLKKEISSMEKLLYDL